MYTTQLVHDNISYLQLDNKSETNDYDTISSRKIVVIPHIKYNASPAQVSNDYDLYPSPQIEQNQITNSGNIISINTSHYAHSTHDNNKTYTRQHHQQDENEGSPLLNERPLSATILYHRLLLFIKTILFQQPIYIGLILIAG